MKPANLAWATVLLLTGLPLAVACTAGDAPPVVAPPTVTIATSPPPQPETPPEEPPPTLAVASRVSDLGLASVRDPRRHAGRSIALIVTELQALERLLASVSASAPDRPRLLRRLAEEYVELAGAAERDRRSGNNEKVIQPARSSALKYYQILKSQYPQWCITPDVANPAHGTGCADEVLYDLALEAERAGQLDLARKSYLELIQSFPASRFIPAAYLAFGEMFIAASESDPSKLALAEQSYAEVVKYPPPDNRVYGYAHYRLAQVHAKKGDDPRALAALLKAVTWAAAYKDDTGLAAAVRRDVIPVYARAGDPARAREFFSRFASAIELEAMLADLEKHLHRGP